MSVTLLGEAKTLEQSTQSGMLVFVFAIVIVFLVLAAQFENLVSATVIMLTVPFGLAAAVYAIVLTGGATRPRDLPVEAEEVAVAVVAVAAADSVEGSALRP